MPLYLHYNGPYKGPVFSRLLRERLYNMRLDWHEVYKEKFTKLDLTVAYLQIELHPDRRKFLVINTSKGLKKFVRIPYGVSPASAISSAKLENEVKNVPKTIVKINIFCYQEKTVLKIMKISKQC